MQTLYKMQYDQRLRVKHLILIAKQKRKLDTMFVCMHFHCLLRVLLVSA